MAAIAQVVLHYLACLQFFLPVLDDTLTLAMDALHRLLPHATYTS